VDERDPLVELLDESRAGEARAARNRERWLRQSAEEGAELAGTLVDLAEHAALVGLATVAGRRHHGVIVAVGGDYCVVRAAGGNEVHLRLDALTTVRLHPGEHHGAATGDRAVAGEQRLVEVLARLAGERRRASLVTVSGETVAGELRSVGTDVVTLRLDGGGTCYVAAPAVTEAAVDG